jgi:hypothetical protein
MGIHDRAWDGIKMVVLANQPLQAMRLEQAIASASPATEVRLSSFEEYAQAFQFCKEQKDVGFLFVHEQCGEASFLSAFRELAGLYSNYGALAYGVVLYDGEPNSFAEKSVGKNPQLLDYLPASSLLDESRTLDALGGIWDQYIGAFESAVLPKALQSSLIAVAEEQMGPDGVNFVSRLSTNLLSDLNVSWLESVAIRWSPLLAAVLENSPAILKNHDLLTHFVEMCQAPDRVPENDLLAFLGGKASLPIKVRALAGSLDEHRRAGSLAAQLRLIESANKPGAPKLVRHVAKNIDRILAFQADANNLRAIG